MADENERSEIDRFCTDAIHAGANPKQWSHRAIVPPISLSTTFQVENPNQRDAKYSYSRTKNPTRNSLEECLAAIEGANKAIAFASGMAAATSALFLLTSGDRILCSADVYGGTYRLFKHCAKKMGLILSFVDSFNKDAFVSELNKKPNMVWIELVTNPAIKLVDVEEFVKTVKQHAPEALICVDNTFLTPYLMRPLDFGADIVMHSISKYINGHSDVIMGCLATNREDLAEQINFNQYAMGAVPSPFDSYLVQRGIRTLALRMKEHCKNAQIVAEFLDQHAHIEQVLYPGLESFAQHELAKKQFSRGYGGMISFFVRGNAEQTKQFLKSLKLITLGVSLGGVESLAELPCTMTHASLTEEEQEKIGIKPNLVRFSVGLENPTDLINDLNQALTMAMK